MPLSFLVRAILILPLILMPLSVGGFFSGFFTALKWQEIYISGILGFFILLYQKQICTPVFEQKINYLIGILVGILFLNYFLHNVPFISEVTLHRLTFIFMAFYTYNIYVRDEGLFQVISQVVTVSFLIYFCVFVAWIKYNNLTFFQNEESYFFTFGNINMSAQYAGISLLFSVYNIFYQRPPYIPFGIRVVDLTTRVEQPKYTFVHEDCESPQMSKKHNLKNERYIKIMSIVVVILCYALLMIFNCRSIDLALSLSLPFLVLYKQGERKITHALAAFLLGVSLLFAGNITRYGNNHIKEIAPNHTTNYSADYTWKGFSILHRLGLWQATLAMTVDHPLGIGAGKFQFYATPYKGESKIIQKLTQELEAFQEKSDHKNYHEITLERTPHNDYLMLLAEDGVIVFILAAFIYILLISRIPRKNFFKKPENILFLSYGIFISVEAFFQFPFSTAYPFYITAIMAGGFFGQFFPEKYFLKKPALLCPLLMLCILIYGIHTYTQYVKEIKKNDTDATVFACKMMPMNWKLCSEAAYNCLRDGRLQETEEILMSQCDLFPNNFWAQKYLISLYYLKNNVGKFCSAIRSYDALFQYKSSYHEAIAFCNLSTQQGKN